MIINFYRSKATPLLQCSSCGTVLDFSSPFNVVETARGEEKKLATQCFPCSKDTDNIVGTYSLVKMRCVNFPAKENVG